MSRRKRPEPMPEPIAPVPPSKIPWGRTSKRLAWEIENMNRWWRQRDNTAKRRFGGRS